MRKLLILSSIFVVLSQTSCGFFKELSKDMNTSNNAKTEQQATSKADTQSSSNQRDTSNQVVAQPKSNNAQTTSTVSNDVNQSPASVPKMAPDAKVFCFDESSTAIPKGKKLNTNSDDFTIIINDKVSGAPASGGWEEFQISVKTKNDKKYYTFTRNELDGYYDDADCGDEICDFQSNYTYEIIEYGFDNDLIHFILLQKNDGSPRIANLFIIDPYVHAVIVEATVYDTTGIEPTKCEIKQNSGDWVFTCNNADDYYQICAAGGPDGPCDTKPPIRRSISKVGFYASRMEEEKNWDKFITYKECLNRN